jgi:polysaccharide biosynthesis/export protein
MRVIRFLFLLLGVAITAAGCAREPVAYVAYSPAPAMSGIDNVVYGAPAPSAPAMMAGRTYAMVPSSAAPYAAAPYAAPRYAAPAQYAAATPYPAATPYAPAPYAAAPAAPALFGYAPQVAAPQAYAPQAYAPQAYAPQAYAPQAGEGGGPYTLDAGDRLRIVVFGQDGLTNSYVVGAGGFIDMPLIGSVAARGMTPDQLTGRISEKLRDGFIREPHVAVEIESYRPFFILGEVTQPGQYPYVANMTAETAVAISGGFSPRAFRKTVILNRNYMGRQVRMSVPLNFPLRPGDTVNVQERWF